MLIIKCNKVIRKIAALAIAGAAFSCTNPAYAKSEREVYITGLGHIFSLGICAVGKGDCTSYLFVESKIEQLCKERPKSVSVVGHSMGASAAIKFTNELHKCGVHVQSAVFLDPLVHPKQFGLPKHVRTLTLYSYGFAGSGEGHADAEYYSGGHIWQAFDPAVLDRARKFLDR